MTAEENISWCLTEPQKQTTFTQSLESDKLKALQIINNAIISRYQKRNKTFLDFVYV